MYHYNLSEQAKEDLFRMYKYGIGQFGLDQADKYFNIIHVCFNKIASKPYMFPANIRYKNIDR